LADSTDQALLLSLKQAIDEFQGDTEVVLVLGGADSKQIIKLPAKIKVGEPSITKLRELAGATNIKIQ
jgi:hypothetical protein